MLETKPESKKWKEHFRVQKINLGMIIGHICFQNFRALSFWIL